MAHKARRADASAPRAGVARRDRAPEKKTTKETYRVERVGAEVDELGVGGDLWWWWC